MPKPVILADDLTGSMDTGVQLLKKWKQVGVVLDESGINRYTADFDALVADSETRNENADPAYSIIRGMAGSLSSKGLELVYKKVDSTLRGNMGKELEALCDAGVFELAVFAPALPWNGRTTLNGIHFVDGKPLEESDLARDPFSSVSTSCIADILRKQTDVKTTTVELDTVRRGCRDLAKKLMGLRDAGFRIAIIDAVNEQDLRNIAGALESTNGLKLLPCGSAGLFTMMNSVDRASSMPPSANLSVHSVDSPESEGESRPEFRKKDVPLVVLSGSPAEMSRKQLEYAKGKGLEILKPDSGALFSGEDSFEKEWERVADLAVGNLKNGTDVAIDGAGPGKGELALAYAGAPEMLRRDGRLIREALALIARRIAETASVSGMMIFGGDTAFHICRSLGAGAIRILGEVEPLVPFGVLTGGCLHGVPVITKAGGFGTEDVVCRTKARIGL